MKKLILIPSLAFLTLAFTALASCNKAEDPFQIRPEWQVNAKHDLSKTAGDWSIETEICLNPSLPPEHDAHRDSLLNHYEEGF